MSKAEEAALKAYPKSEGIRELKGLSARPIFIQGYEKAEEDLALTWEDLRTINDLFLKVDAENSKAWDYELIEQDLPFPYGQKFYEEVLRRFREMKNK